MKSFGEKYLQMILSQLAIPVIKSRTISIYGEYVNVELFLVKEVVRTKANEEKELQYYYNNNMAIVKAPTLYHGLFSQSPEVQYPCIS